MPIFVRMNPHGALPIRKRRGGTVGRLTLMVVGVATTATACTTVPTASSTAPTTVVAAACKTPGSSARPPDVDDATRPRRTRPAAATATTQPAATTTTRRRPRPRLLPRRPRWDSATRAPGRSRPTSPWNMPRGDGAAFDGRQVATGGNINSANGWGVSVAGAGYALVDQATSGNRTTKDTSRSSVATA